MREEVLKGHVEIISRREKKEDAVTPFNTIIKIDGKIVSNVQSINLTVDVENMAPVITFVMVPDEAVINFDGIRYEFKDDEETVAKCGPSIITTASFYHYECDCGANFPVEENLISVNETKCPACGKEYSFHGGTK